MCNDNSSNGCNEGILNTLKTILVLQKTANKISSEPETCDRNFLGSNNGCGCEYNTRPITIYGCNNTLFEFPTDKEETDGCMSAVLRCEKIEGCTCTCRVLKKKENSLDDCKYKATDSFVTINLSCCCCLRCLPDTYVDLC